MKCPKCGCKLDMEYMQSSKGGYSFVLYTFCTNDDCDFEEYEEN